jgi:hypothetical protein
MKNCRYEITTKIRESGLDQIQIKVGNKLTRDISDIMYLYHIMMIGDILIELQRRPYESN